MQASLNLSDGLTLRFESGLTSLARSDFARTRALADSFQREEVRMLGRLLIAQALLTVRSEKGSTAVRTQ